MGKKKEKKAKKLEKKLRKEKERLKLDKYDLMQWNEVAFGLAAHARGHFVNVFTDEQLENDPVISYLYQTILKDQTYLYDNPKELMWRIGRLAMLNKMASEMRDKKAGIIKED